MKTAFNFTIANINITIEGQPVQLEGINITVDTEASVHELATYGGMVKDMVNQIKDMVNRAPVPAAPAPVVNINKEPTPSPVINMAKPTPSPCPITKPTEKKVIDVNTTFEELEEYLSKRRGWSSDHMGHLNYKSDTATEGAEFREVEIVLDSAIRFHFLRNSEDILKTVHIHVYPNRVYVSGIAPYYLERFLKGCGVIGLDHLWDVVKGMEVKNS